MPPYSVWTLQISLLSTYHFAEGFLLNILMTFYRVSEFPSSMQYNENMKEVVEKSEYKV